MRHHRQAFGSGLGDAQDLGVDPGDPGGEGVLRVSGGPEVGRAQVGHRCAPRRRLALDPERRQQPAGVDGPFAPWQGPDHLHPERIQEGRRRLQPPRGVVVAGDDHRAELRPSQPGLDQEGVERPLGGRRRVGRVEHVAGDHQGVGRPLLEQVEQPAEKLLVLEGPVVAVEGVAQVPVGGVDEAEHGVPMILRGTARATEVRGRRRGLGTGTRRRALQRPLMRCSGRWCARSAARGPAGSLRPAGGGSGALSRSWKGTLRLRGLGGRSAQGDRGGAADSGRSARGDRGGAADSGRSARGDRRGPVRSSPVIPSERQLPFLSS